MPIKFSSSRVAQRRTTKRDPVTGELITEINNDSDNDFEVLHKNKRRREKIMWNKIAALPHDFVGGYESLLKKSELDQNTGNLDKAKCCQEMADMPAYHLSGPLNNALIPNSGHRHNSIAIDMSTPAATESTNAKLAKITEDIITPNEIHEGQKVACACSLSDPCCTRQ